MLDKWVLAKSGSARINGISITRFSFLMNDTAKGCFQSLGDLRWGESPLSLFILIIDALNYFFLK